MKAIADAWKTTGAKLVLNFGKTVAPVVDSLSEVMKEVQVNDECDQDCAVKCLSPLAPKETFYFD